jgi:hypothetical protein
VSSDVKGNDGKVSNAEVLGTIDLELGVNDTTILSRQHRSASNGVCAKETTRLVGFIDNTRGMNETGLTESGNMRILDVV